MEHLFRELFHIGIAVGYASPKEHSGLVGVESAAQGVHDFFGLFPSWGIGFHIGAGVPFVSIVISLCGGKLHGAEGAAVNVAFHPHDPLDELRVGGQHAHSPARHVVALGHGVELYAAFLGSGNLQDTQLFTAVQYEAVRVVIDDDEVVPEGKIDQRLVSLAHGTGTGRHVGIVGPHDFYTAQVCLFQSIQVGLPCVFLAQFVWHHFRSQYFAQAGVSGVTGIGDKHLVAGIDKGKRNVKNAFL